MRPEIAARGGGRLAAVDRLVHHATIVELNVESYRRRTAVERRKGPARPPTRATINTAAD
ncbi:MAG: hypothetical protein U1E40_14355 [Amaricoccus sp.]